MTETRYWCTSSGRIELYLTEEQARSASHPGQCDVDVRALSEHPNIKAQLDALNPEVLRKELKEYGAWDAADLADHEHNKERILWLAAGDICDGFDEEDDEEERISCDRCEMLSINGVACHEIGCPNMGAKFEDGEWVKYVECFECGCEVRKGETCSCQEPYDGD
jgi:hypothetical protein